MSAELQRVKDQKTSLSPMLSVRNGAKAVEFYKAAFPPHPAKTALYGDPRSPGHKNFSPESLGG